MKVSKESNDTPCHDVGSGTVPCSQKLAQRYADRGTSQLASTEQVRQTEKHGNDNYIT